MKDKNIIAEPIAKSVVSGSIYSFPGQGIKTESVSSGAVCCFPE